jgi:hypothetical protein
MDGLIFSDLMGIDYGVLRSAGPYRVATSLRRSGYEVEVIDFASHFMIDEIKSIIESRCDRSTLFIGWSTTFFFKKKPRLNMNTLERTRGLIYTKEEEIDLIDWIKSKFPKIKIIIGGHRSIYRDVHRADYYIHGYSDTAILHVLDSIKSGASVIGLEPPDVNGAHYLDANKSYPASTNPELDIQWNISDYICPTESLPIEISRGCIFRCAFCAFPFNGKREKDYYRTKESISNELLLNYEKWGTTNYSIIDDTLNDSAYKIELLSSIAADLPFKFTYTAYLRLDLLATNIDVLKLLLKSGLRVGVFGIETLNPIAAKIIGKGMSADKQFDALKIIRQISEDTVSTHSNFLVGLPEEPLISCEQTHQFLTTSDHCLDSWNWFGVGIMAQKDRVWSSRIEDNPEKFGYTILDDRYSPVAWRNKHMSSDDAGNAAKSFNQALKRKSKIGGWMINPLISVGFDHNFIKSHSKLDFPWTEARKRTASFIDLYKKRKLS